MLPRPRAILLDLDGTLLDHDGASRAALDAVLEHDGVRPTSEQHELWYRLQEDYFQRYLDGELSFEEQRIERVRSFVLSVSDRELDVAQARDWFDLYRFAYERHWYAYDDVLPFLKELKSQGSEAASPPVVAVVTNGEGTQQRAKLTALGLQSLPLFASSAVGVAKPDPRIFVHVCRELEVAPGETWFIGDNYDADALGSHDAGLVGIWLDRHGAHSRHLVPDRGTGSAGMEQEGDCGGPARASSLADIVEWLANAS